MPRSEEEILLGLVPRDGSAIGNVSLHRALDEALGRKVSDKAYEKLRDALVIKGVLAKGSGRGGSVRRVTFGATSAVHAAKDFDLESPWVPEPPKEKSPGSSKPPTSKAPRSTPSSGAPQVLSYRHLDKRVNNPEVGMVTPDTDPDEGKTTWAYDPHLDPALQFDVGRAQVEKIIDDALGSGDEAAMRSALETLRHMQSPYLTWTGKAERTSFDVDLVSLHVHERIDPASILSAVRKGLTSPLPPGEGPGVREKTSKPPRPSYIQPDLFAAPFENLPLRDAIDFYRHEKGWSNRLIAGDSLLVMNSLLQKEGMAGQVQMIYIDPPYGIKYGSNFQPFVNKRDVKDRSDEDLTQEPEMIKAFRDTWELGIHSYLSYLRDRLLLTRELLCESGSVFVQISDENIHHVRELLDDVFLAKNFCSQIAFTKTTGLASDRLPDRCDYILWYAKSIDVVKYRPQFVAKEPGQEGAQQYEWVERASGVRTKPGDLLDLRANDRVFNHDNLTSFLTTPHLAKSFEFKGSTFSPAASTQWKTTRDGLRRLGHASRLMNLGRTLRYVRFLDDFPVVPFTSLWTDTGISGFSDPKIYAVQTSTKVIERCLSMTTDPGDLVLDPTCGSGTTAFVAEKWGRRWITCDTSRVAMTLTKQRLMTASYDYYELKYPHEGLKSGFIYKTVPHVTLKSIANNPEIDEIYERMHPAIDAALKTLNEGLKVGVAFTVTEGGRKGQTLKLGKGDALHEWEVPFDFPSDWPAGVRTAFDAFHAARQAMQKRMDESIAAHADQETLYDQPQVSRNKLRITGPFSVEAVPFPTVLALDETLPQQEADAAIARSGESSRQHGWRDELLKTGIRGKGGQMLRFAELDTLPGTRHLHCSGTLAETGERVVVSFGPEHAALEQRQVEMALREAGELFPRPKMIVYCAFTFDPEAAKDIDNLKGITALKAQMNTDLLTEDLKKARASNQSFWLMGQPDVEARQRPDGLWEVEVHGFDYFDTVKGDLVSGGKSRIALWLLDTDYDERSLFPKQVFFPMAGKDDGWFRLKKDIRAELDEGLLEHFHGTVSLPFEAGDNRKVAVKIVDDRGIESLKVIALEER